MKREKQDEKGARVLDIEKQTMKRNRKKNQRKKRREKKIDIKSN